MWYPRQKGCTSGPISSGSSQRLQDIWRWHDAADGASRVASAARPLTVCAAGPAAEKEPQTVWLVLGFFDHGFSRRCLVHRHGRFVALSEQQLVDCNTVDFGCNSGLMDKGFAFAEKKAYDACLTVYGDVSCDSSVNETQKVCKRDEHQR